MNFENKLDEDFLFYLTFMSGYYDRIKPEADVQRCQQWLMKLCSECYKTKEQKRNRNIFLSNLVLCMQNGALGEPFTLPSYEVDVSESAKYFGDPQVELEDQQWLRESPENLEESPPERSDGRTYVATRAMPGGQGAMAYVAVTLGPDEAKWLGGGEGTFDEHLARKFGEMVPEPNEMEKILIRRKDPRERRKVITFYEAVVKSIDDELDGITSIPDGDTAEILMDQLVEDLRHRGIYGTYEAMPAQARRQELLIMLHDRCKERITKITKREEVLDDIGDKVVPKSFFETSVRPDDKFELPAIMWQEAINKAPSKKNQERLLETYPVFLVEKFLSLLTKQKEDIALLLHKRHERIIIQMKKELRKEGQAGVKKVADVVQASEHAEMIMKQVVKARKAQIESKKKFDEEKNKAARTKRSEAYEEMRKTVIATQENVEAEADRGWELTGEINKTIEEQELSREVNEQRLIDLEEANMQIMKNIKRLRAAVKTYEGTVKHLQDVIKSTAQGGQQTQFMF